MVTTLLSDIVIRNESRKSLLYDADRFSVSVLITSLHQLSINSQDEFA